MLFRSTPIEREATAGRSSSRRGAAAVAAIYGILVLLLWAPFTAHSGLPSETVFPLLSETSGPFEGFLYRFDPLRIHTNTFYQLPYVIGEALGIGGSYIPYQVVHALLWWARGFLAFLLVRKFLPRAAIVSYVVGALVIVNAADGALQWIGQLNQFGFIFWMLLACYLLTSALEADTSVVASLLTVAACAAEYMSLWSYESQILLLLLFPVVLLLHPRQRWRRLAAMAMAWYAVPATYIWLTAMRYSQAAGHTYQESVLRKNWGLTSILSDWWFNVAASLRFWDWIRGANTSTSLIFALSCLAAVVFLSGCPTLIRRHGEGPAGLFSLSPRTWWIMLATGFVVLILSFPVYLLLEAARGLWRTQLLSAAGAGVVLSATIGLVAQALPVGHASQRFAFLAMAAAVVLCGSIGALQLGAIHRSEWDRHRSTMARVLRAVPNLKHEAVVILTNVPKDDDPFGHDMWFDVALRLVYPGIPVAGVYFYSDGSRAPGDNLVADDGRWKWDGTAYPPLLRDTSLANTIVVNDAASRGTGLEPTIPAYACSEHCASGLYNPAAIISDSISPRTVRRYRLSGGFPN